MDKSIRTAGTEPLPAQLRRWTVVGLISSEQAAVILLAERRRCWAPARRSRSTPTGVVACHKAGSGWLGLMRGRRHAMPH